MPSEFSDAEPSRRAFIARLAGAAFVAPVIASFALDGVANASERGGRKGHHHHGNPNQGHPNQGYPNQGYPNQCNPNQAIGNQTS